MKKLLAIGILAIGTLSGVGQAISGTTFEKDIINFGGYSLKSQTLDDITGSVDVIENRDGYIFESRDFELNGEGKLNIKSKYTTTPDAFDYGTGQFKDSYQNHGDKLTYLTNGTQYYFLDSTGKLWSNENQEANYATIFNDQDLTWTLKEIQKDYMFIEGAWGSSTFGSWVNESGISVSNGYTSLGNWTQDDNETQTRFEYGSYQSGFTSYSGWGSTITTGKVCGSDYALADTDLIDYTVPVKSGSCFSDGYGMRQDWTYQKRTRDYTYSRQSRVETQIRPYTNINETNENAAYGINTYPTLTPFTSGVVTPNIQSGGEKTLWVDEADFVYTLDLGHEDNIWNTPKIEYKINDKNTNIKDLSSIGGGLWQVDLTDELSNPLYSAKSGTKLTYEIRNIYNDVTGDSQSGGLHYYNLFNSNIDPVVHASEMFQLNENLTLYPSGIAAVDLSLLEDVQQMLLNYEGEISSASEYIPFKYYYNDVLDTSRALFNVTESKFQEDLKRDGYHKIVITTPVKENGNYIDYETYYLIDDSTITFDLRGEINSNSYDIYNGLNLTAIDREFTIELDHKLYNTQSKIIDELAPTVYLVPGMEPIGSAAIMFEIEPINGDYKHIFSPEDHNKWFTLMVQAETGIYYLEYVHVSFDDMEQINIPTITQNYESNILLGTNEFTSIDDSDIIVSGNIAPIDGPNVLHWNKRTYDTLETVNDSLSLLESGTYIVEMTSINGEIFINTFDAYNVNPLLSTIPQQFTNGTIAVDWSESERTITPTLTKKAIDVVNDEIIAITKGGIIVDDGIYELILTDDLGNRTTYNFTIVTEFVEELLNSLTIVDGEIVIGTPEWIETMEVVADGETEAIWTEEEGWVETTELLGNKFSKSSATSYTLDSTKEYEIKVTDIAGNLRTLTNDEIIQKGFAPALVVVPDSNDNSSRNIIIALGIALVIVISTTFYNKYKRNKRAHTKHWK